MSAANARGTPRTKRWGVAAAIVCTTSFAVAPSAALATPGLDVTLAPPSVVAAGDTAVPGSLTLTNTNTLPETIATICNAGDPLPCPVGGNGITLVPSCGGVDAATSTCAVPSLGVFKVSPTANGATGTECARVPFTVTPLNDGFGTVSLSPPPGMNIQLPVGSVCRIDFTMDVLAVPTDADPTVGGVQTFQVTNATQRSDNQKIASGPGVGSVTFKTPPTTPPATPPTTPPATPPTSPPTTGSQAPGKTTVGSSGPGSAQISGKSGCATKNFNVTVTGKQIRRVTFFLDRKRVKTLAKPNAGRAFRFRVLPGTLKRGTHRVTAQTTFTKASGTRARTLRVVFQRCSRRSPQFTG
jgi:hypothetical protein